MNKITFSKINYFILYRKLSEYSYIFYNNYFYLNELFIFCVINYFVLSNDKPQKLETYAFLDVAHTI